MTDTGDREKIAQLHRAEAKSQQARDRLIGTLTELQQRLSPKVLMAEARDEFQEKASELLDEGIAFAKARPGMVAVVIAGVIAWLFRGPILRSLWSAISGLGGNRTGRSGVDRTNATAAPGSYQTRSSHDDE